ncbi:delta-like protein 4 [Mizuhopecten yessoensis]|nr:delta-like protein 4 [Mizuhopecten yessoensis]
MEKKSLSSTSGDKIALKDVTVETPTGDSSISSKSKKCCRAQVYYISICVVLGAGLISALIYFILLHVNAGDPDSSKSMALGTTDAMSAGDPEVCCFNPCMNSGGCREANDTNPAPFTCQCTELYEGVICENRIFVDKCVDNPCQNGGTCSNINTDPFFSCTCTMSHTGKSCDQEKSFNQAVHTSAKLPSCTSSYCKNGGTCSLSRGNLYCACADGYTGDRCEEIETTTAPTTTTASGS